MPSVEAIQQQHRVDRSTSPALPRSAVQELKALFASEPSLTTDKSDLRTDAVQLLQEQLPPVLDKSDDIPERGTWGSKVSVMAVNIIVSHLTFFISEFGMKWC